jgi:hypothetical protein
MKTLREDGFQMTVTVRSAAKEWRPSATAAKEGPNPLIRLGPVLPVTLRAGARHADNCVFFVKSNQGLRG